MSARAHCQLNRRRRIVKADICDRHHLPVRAGDKRRQSALFFNGLLGQLLRRQQFGLSNPPLVNRCRLGPKQFASRR
jgi:hypothetical protein